MAKKLKLIHWHGWRAALLGGPQGIADLKTAGVTHVCCPYQHGNEPYIDILNAARIGVIWSIGATERPTPKDIPGSPRFGLAWDLEGGGDPLENAQWFTNLFFRSRCWFPVIFSGFPGVLYFGQTVSERYGCRIDLLHQLLSKGYGHPMAWPWFVGGGIRGPLPPGALEGTPAKVPVFPVIVPPLWAEGTEVEREQLVRSETRDLLSLTLSRGNGGLALVQAVDGAPGSRWPGKDAWMCRVIGEGLKTEER